MRCKSLFCEGKLDHAAYGGRDLSILILEGFCPKNDGLARIAAWSEFARHP
jgi:hypothetical protein